MSKKSFKDNPALAFLSDTQEDTQEARPRSKAHKRQEPSPIPAAEAPQLKRPYMRTQGRKGQKKPRINLAFDSVEFLDEIRCRAERDGMSVTQLVNEAVAQYLDERGPAEAVWEVRSDGKSNLLA